MAMQDYGSNTNLYDPEHTWSVCEYILLFFAWLVCIIIPIFWFSIFRSVRDYERAVIFSLGKISGGAKGPGIFLINPLTDTIRVIDLRIVTYNLPPQAMMTKDAVTVTVDAISFMKVMDPIRAVLEVDDYRQAFNGFAATTLRSVIGTYDMEMLLSNRDEINAKAQSVIEAESERERRAKVVSSMGEAEAAQQLAQAADIIADSPGALQLRYLHTLVKISAEKNSTILFPLPMEIMRGMQAFSDHQVNEQKLRRRKNVEDANAILDNINLE